MQLNLLGVRDELTAHGVRALLGVHVLLCMVLEVLGEVLVLLGKEVLNCVLVTRFGRFRLGVQQKLLGAVVLLRLGDGHAIIGDVRARVAGVGGEDAWGLHGDCLLAAWKVCCRRLTTKNWKLWCWMYSCMITGGGTW